MFINLPKIEEKILKFWQKNKIFEKSISQRKGKKIFSFYDGPPFATGKPHYGHILATTIKDTVLRYWTMKGYQVPRRVGWDCHGLPVENLIEKELGVKNKKEIEKLGIEKFNSACRASVFRCVKDFEETLKRVGRWADYKNAYATLDNDYIESVWWVFKKLWDKNLVYKDYRVSPYCPRCGTPLSNFEVNQGYRDIKETSIYLKFKIVNTKYKIPNTYLLVWTTTPWTLPANLALAVHPDFDYVLIKQNKENYILAKERLAILEGEYKIIQNFKGKNLIGLRYKPLFDYLIKINPENIENAFQVLPADFVSLEEGTGIVHLAPMYGEEDFQIAKKFNLPLYHTVDEFGCFKKQIKEWQGQFVKNSNPLIIENLKERNFLYKKEEIVHSYPFCWRCETPLLYFAIENWYIAVRKIKKQLIENNKKIHWVPDHLKYGRFGKWLEEAKDWAFSRARFWGAPLPIWLCQIGKEQKTKNKEQKYCDNIKVIGSIKELEKLAGRKIKDLHRPYIDEIVFRCEKCGSKMKRVSEVFDCWFESGSMPYAQFHYPFENKNLVEKTFPADFIAEGLDQTRGWFYTLNVLATALTLKYIGLGKNQPAFKNVIVNGLVLDTQGRKLSKKLGNYPEPREIFDKYGADALRYFLLASTPIGEDYRFSSEGVKEVFNKVISTLFHSYLFFETYKDKKFKLKKNFKPIFLLNKWIISKVNNLNQEIVKWMDSYELTKAGRLFNDFIDDFSNWYIRRARRCLKLPQNLKESQDFSQTLYSVLIVLSKLIAPFTPFISEYIYQSLRSKQKTKNQKSKTIFPLSIHLCDYPKANPKLIDKKLEDKMGEVRQIVAKALAERAKLKIKVRQPLNKLQITNYKLQKEKELLDLIKEEVNVKEITFGRKLKLDTKITSELKEEGIVREVIRQIQEMRKKLGLKPKDKISIRYSGPPDLNKILTKNKNLILKETKSKEFLCLRPDLKQKEKFDLEGEKQIDSQNLWLAIKRA